jgi:hypothetical protein
MENENEIEEIATVQHDDTPSIGWALLVICLLIAGVIGIGWVAYKKNWLASEPTAKLSDYLIASNSAVYWYTLSQRLTLQTQEQHKFIMDTHKHTARFFTNEYVSELEMAPGRISTFRDTNIARINAFRVQVTPTNIVVSKAYGSAGDRMFFDSPTVPLEQSR